MGRAWHLNDYQQAIEALIADTIAVHGEDVVTDDLIAEVIEGTLPKMTDTLYTELARRSSAMLREHRRLRKGFVRRNFRRWRAGFDLLERLIVTSQETGQAINDALRPAAIEKNDPLFEAVITNHARAIQISREILTLMIGGFPDGALARWRTLHEVAVTSKFLSQHGAPVAERYILHDHITSYKRALNYMEHYERANLEPIESDVLRDLKQASDQIISEYGPAMRHDYGWAAECLGKERPNFVDLEISTGLDHWRPRYKWSAINTHGSYRRPNSTLATSEADKPVLAVGESNSGMTDPAHMTAISLNLATFPIITLQSNVDRLVVMQVMLRLSDEIGETFLRLDRETWNREMKRRQRTSFFTRWFK